MSLKKAVACVKRNKKFLITAHTNPEGDALGAQLAFYRLLKAMKKQAIIINEDNTPLGYDFLPGINNIVKFKKYLRDIKFDCFTILDCSDLSRCGEVYRLNVSNSPILNIDHHISNARFGDVNWVEPRSSSTSEMIYRLYKKLRVPLDRDTAMLLYVGIMTDTGSFHYSNTSSFTHKVVSELLRFNLDITQIYKNVYENIPFQDMQLLSNILPTLKRDASGKIAWLHIEQQILKNRSLSFDLSEYVLSFLRAIKDIEVAALFKENFKRKNEIRVNLRSRGKIDVNEIARFFGGGGHKTASGCTIKGSMEKVKKMVLKKIKDSFK